MRVDIVILKTFSHLSMRVDIAILNTFSYHSMRVDIAILSTFSYHSLSVDIVILNSHENIYDSYLSSFIILKQLLTFPNNLA